MVEIALIRKADHPARPRFGPFTSAVCCAAIIGLHAGIASILVERF